MSTLGYILLFTFLGSIVSLVGGAILLLRERLVLKISHILMSFAAGVLLGTAFFDLLPEALEASLACGFECPYFLGLSPIEGIFLSALSGVLIFFLLERFIHWFHHHHEHKGNETKPTVPLIILGDSVHNFIDGVAIAAAFLLNIPLGIVTALAVAAHEIPQEIGDFGILLHRGISGKRVLLLNMFSALTALAGALLTFIIGGKVGVYLPIIIALAAGFFIYIAASDLIPEIHQEKRGRFALAESIVLLLGVITIWFSTMLLEG